MKLKEAQTVLLLHGYIKTGRHASGGLFVERWAIYKGRGTKQIGLLVMRRMGRDFLVGLLRGWLHLTKSRAEPDLSALLGYISRAEFTPYPEDSGWRKS
jgi:hypothetical protein